MSLTPGAGRGDGEESCDADADEKVPCEERDAFDVCVEREEDGDGVGGHYGA